MGTSGIVYLGLTRRKYCTIQFRTGVGSTGKTWTATHCLYTAATLGNTAGGMTCYYMGRLGKISWIEKYFKVKKEKVDKMVKIPARKGAFMAFFAFLPAIGEVISIALGFMRSNIWLTTASMFFVKADTLHSASVRTGKRMERRCRMK